MSVGHKAHHVRRFFEGSTSCVIGGAGRLGVTFLTMAGVLSGLTVVGLPLAGHLFNWAEELEEKSSEKIIDGREDVDYSFSSHHN